MRIRTVLALSLGTGYAVGIGAGAAWGAVAVLTTALVLCAGGLAYSLLQG